MTGDGSSSIIEAVVLGMRTRHREVIRVPPLVPRLRNLVCIEVEVALEGRCEPGHVRLELLQWGAVERVHGGEINREEGN